jgi:hypothetical protein
MLIYAPQCTSYNWNIAMWTPRSIHETYLDLSRYSQLKCQFSEDTSCSEYNASASTGLSDE